MRSFTRCPAFLFALSLLMAASCRDEVSPADGLVATLTTSAPSTRPSEIVTVSIVVSNYSEDTRQFISGYCLSLPFVLESSTGEVVEPTGQAQACTLGSPPVETLAPGDFFTVVTEWGGTGRIGNQRTPMSAGTYRVRPRVLVPGADPLSGSAISFAITN
jgi:hypothetical protein